MSKKFQCVDCNGYTQKFYATLENPSEKFDGVIEYCHFCDIGFYEVSPNHFEFVEIEQPERRLANVVSSPQYEDSLPFDLSC